MGKKRKTFPEDSVGEIGMSAKDRLEQICRLVMRMHDELQGYVRRYEASHSYADVKDDRAFKALTRLKDRLHDMANDLDDDVDDDEDDDV